MGAAVEIARYQENLQGPELVESAAIFEKSWQVYSKLVDLDFLAHKELLEQLERHVLCSPASAHLGGALRVLDLGCGDCSRVAASLQRAGTRLSSFTGVDLAGPALELARHNLAACLPGCHIRLACQELEEFMQGCQEQFDLLLSAFAIHHLSLGSKAELLRHAARCLRSGAVFAVIDVFRTDGGESREGFMTRAKHQIDTRLTDDQGVTEEDRVLFWDHITQCDYPEDTDTFRRLGEAAGFVSVECMYVDATDLYRLVLLRK